MIAFLNVLMDVAYLSVVFLALRLGGRYERYLGFAQAAMWVAVQLVQRFAMPKVPLAAFMALDLGLLAAHLWLLSRVRSAWLVWSAGAVALSIVTEAAYGLRLLPSRWIYFNTVAVLGYVQLGALAYAVLRRRVGPPFRPAPAVGSG
ncbi:hypothetical protein [Caulobacter sp. 17J80-11]|uniref:hypothetical protein n=1 Tax=Caulobacter sp. 17J80-11 TaxID=2763502 RepID=UPI001653E89B|nr:hypothetical protein [Caulobacter sp. 17J80-11]MBC6980430.1 hypothetical protein [Caulobacter sp. 17J80-11]